MRFITLLLVAACGSGGGFPDARPVDTIPPKGSFSIAWTVTDLAGKPITCSEISAATMTVTYHNRAFDGALTEVFSCSTLMGTGTGLIEGSYDFMFELDSATATLATAPSQFLVDIPRDTTTALMPVSFAVDATGAVALTLQTGKPGGNCAATAAMGAGITSTTITLVHTGTGACQPLTFAITGGGSYTVNCTTPMIGPCIENNQTLSASNVPSDGYTIHVRGTTTAPCWKNDDQLQVPAKGMTLTRPLNLAYATGSPGC